MNATLVIMAAGMGSRFGGVKQIEHMGPHGEILMDYSIYDAVCAGFNKVVVIVKPEILADVQKLNSGIQNTLRGMGKEVTFEYVLQRMEDIPASCRVNPERVKPLGTVHAVLAARDAVHEPFLVINSDDYYGSAMYDAMYASLTKLDADHGSMAAYLLKNTLGLGGNLTRGICAVKDGKLTAVNETYGISMDADGRITDRDGNILCGNSVASMNVWGFTPQIFSAMQQYLTLFLQGLAADDIKSECLLPTFADHMIKKGYTMQAVDFDAAWLGVTTKADVPPVAKALAQMDYPPLV